MTAGREIAPQMLFLLGGGSTIFEVVAQEFVASAGGRQAVIALLLAGGQGWEDYLPQYTLPWTRRGVRQIHTVVPGEGDTLDLEAASARLCEATGIFIGGGDTRKYHRLFATEPIRSIIRERFQEGAPVAGLSAGALIAPEVCVIPPEEAGGSSARIVTGLGLVSGLIVGVHFSERDSLPHVLEAMIETRTATGLGIDEAACAVLENGRLRHVLGESVHTIEVTDFEPQSYKMTSAAC